MATRDIVSRAKRSEMMRAVRQRGTPLERRVAQAVRGLGHHYRLNNRRLPGSPDLSNGTRRWAIFCNGCFWHGHKNCGKTKGGRGSRVPARHAAFWRTKIAGNRARDARKCRQLRAAGFRVLLIWECQLRQPERLEERLRRWLGGA